MINARHEIDPYRDIHKMPKAAVVILNKMQLPTKYKNSVDLHKVLTKYMCKFLKPTKE